MAARKKPQGARLRDKQMGVALPHELRARLEKASTAAGISIAEEIRRRLERSYKEDDFYASRPDLRKLALMVQLMARMAENATGDKWNEHDETGMLLSLAIKKHLELHGAADEDDYVDEIEVCEAMQRKGMKKSYEPKWLAEQIESRAHFQIHGQPWDFDAAEAREDEMREREHENALRRMTPEEREQA